MSSNWTCDEENCTVTYFSGHRSYWALALLIIPVFTLLGNLLVIISVIRKRNLHSPINFFILGLAMADLCVALAVMPFAVYVEFNEHWELGILLCDLYCAADVACSTASIFLLTVISFDRYVAATQPIRYANGVKGIKRVAVINSAVWFVSMLIASPMVLGLNNVPERDLSKCMFYNADFLIYSSTGSFCIPLVIIIYLYARIYCVIRERGKFAKKRYELISTANRCSVVQDTATIKSISNTSIRVQTLAETLSPIADKKNQRSNQRERNDFSPNRVKRDSFDRGNGVSEVQLPNTGKTQKSATRSQSNFISNSDNKLHIFSRQNSKYFTHDRKRSNSWPLISSNVLITDLIAHEQIDQIFPLSNEKAEETRNSVSFFTKTSVTLISTDESVLISIIDQKNRFSKSAMEFSKSIQEMKFPTPTNETKFFKPRSRTRTKRSFDDAAHKYRNRFLRRLSTTFLLWRSPRESAGADSGEKIDSSLSDRQSFLVQNKKFKASRKSTSKSQRKEKKATKTLAIVLGVFLICWVPFFALNLMNAVCIKLKRPTCQIGFLPFFLTTWLGYMNSLMNPIIYTIFNADFRRAFKEILCPFMSKQNLGKR